MIDKEIIKKNFSKCAPYYDKYSTIQNLCAKRLIAEIKINDFANILELGCGTGNYTKLLREKFPQAKIKVVDISFEMLEVAKEKLQQNNIDFILADAETIHFEEGFDLISSNASFQWFADLERTLSKYRDLLNKNGLIFFSIFGPGSFFELNESLQGFLGKAASINSHSFFIEKKKIEQILQRYFKKVEVEDRSYKERYNSLPSLLKKIKYTGVRGSGIDRRKFWTSKTVKVLERIYKEKFKDIIATYEVYFCKGVK